MTSSVPVFLVGFLLVGGSFRGYAAEGASVFRAAAAVVDISPPKLPSIIAGGFLEKTADKINDRLRARCIVLDDGRSRIAFAIVDTCMMTRSLIDEAKELARRQCGIAVDHMMVSATHTHSAPAAMACLGTRLDRDYAAFLPGKIAEGIAAAANNLQPARIGWASIDDWEHTHNRRWIRRPETAVVDPFGDKTGLANMHPGYLSPDIMGPSGPVDPGLSVLSIQTREGRPLAVLANYSQHYFGSPAVSADYYGMFCKHIARLLGQPGEGNGPFVCAMSQGTSGDLMWMDYGSSKKSFTCDSYAEAVARYVAQALKGVKHHDRVPLAIVEKKLTLDYRVPDTKRLEWAKPIAAKIQDDLAKDKQEVYAKEAVILDERKRTELKLQAIRIGGLSIATLPNEVYALTGLKLKAQSPLESHFNIELANGAEGYIPTPEQHVLGGYTTWPARTAGLEVQAEPKIVEILLGALEEATGRKRRTVRDEHGPYAKAVLGAGPAGYWRLNEMAGRMARNAVAGAPDAKITGGAALYLPGIGSGTGCGPGEELKPSAFSGPKQINRSVHFAGGEMTADLRLGDESSIALWFWLGEASGASERTGELVALSPAEQIVVRQFPDHRAELALLSAAQDSADARGPRNLRADDWHLAVIVRRAGKVSVHVDGGEKSALSGAALPGQIGTLRFGRGLQGKLDEIAVFNRALAPAEVTGFWKASGIAEERARETAAREREEKLAAERANPPRFAAGYEDAIAALRPAVNWPLQAPQKGQTLQGDVKIGPTTLADFNSGRLRAQHGGLGTSYTVSLWFNNRTPNNTGAVTAYLFSRGRDGDRNAPGDHFGIGGTFNPGLTGRLFFFNGNATKETLAGRTVIPPGTWNHAVFIRDGKHLKAFLNGAEQLEFSGDASDTTAAVKDFFIGARSDMFAPLHGYMAQFALFDRALTDAEALKLHSTSGQPRGTPQVSEVPAQNPKLETQPLSPEESLKKIHVRQGFRVSLVASEPQVLDPVAFDWDDRGRLWVVEMADYPLGMDGKGKAGGRVRLLEDVDGDGRFEKSTLFADGLSFPNGILTWRDGVLVTAAPDILFLRDTNGDGRADETKVLFTGFSAGNQQLRVNGLRWGMDGWVYCAAGGHHANYNKDTFIECKLTGEKVALGARDFRINPDTGELDPQTGPSQFGRCRDDWDHWFGVQNSKPLWHYVLQDHYLRRNPDVIPPDPVKLLYPLNPPVHPASPPEKRYHSFNQSGRYTSACGIEFYRGDSLFNDNWMHAFTCEPFHNLVQHHQLQDDGVSFKAVTDTDLSMPDFFASEDRWCRPVMVRTGPDGAIYIADMYRYMIEHPQFLPQNGKDELQPHYRMGEDRGRIWRVGRVGRADVNPGFATTHEQINALRFPNGWVRDKAQMMLLWRKPGDIAPWLITLARSSTLPQARAQAAWTLQLLGGMTPRLCEKLLADPSPRVREQGLRLAERFPEDAALLSAMATRVNDEDAKVRLQLACSLGAFNQPGAAEALAALLQRDAGDDAIVGMVLVSIGSRVGALLKPAVIARMNAASPAFGSLARLTVGSKDEGLIARLIEAAEVAGEKIELPQLQRLRGVLEALAGSGTSFGKLRQTAADPALKRQLTAMDDSMDRIEAGISSAGHEIDPAFDAAAVAVLALDAPRTGRMVELARRWIGASSGIETQRLALKVIGATRPADAVEMLTGDWASRTPQARHEIIDLLLSHGAWTQALLSQVKNGAIAAGAIDAQQRASLLQHPNKAVANAAAAWLKTAGTPTRAAVLDKFKPALTLAGDAGRGKQVFATAACIACHQLDGAGLPVGPDLRSVVAHAPEKLLSSILDPSAVIEPGFTAYHGTLKSGEQLYGIVTTETSGSITMKLAGNVSRSVLRSDLNALKSTQASLMPDGLEALFTPQSLADLIAYLRTPK